MYFYAHFYSHFKHCTGLFIFLYIKDAKFFMFKVKTEYICLCIRSYFVVMLICLRFYTYIFQRFTELKPCDLYEHLSKSPLKNF